MIAEGNYLKQNEMNQQQETKYNKHSEELEDSDWDDFKGPILIPKASPTIIPAKTVDIPDRGPSLQELHIKKQAISKESDKHKIPTHFDHSKGLNEEFKQELLRKLNADGGLSGRFTSSSKK